MDRLDELPADHLRVALDGVEDAKAAKRLLVALAHNDGVDVDTISVRYGIPQSTIYYWFDRLEKQPLADALQDEPRPGRPPKLSSTRPAEVETWLEGSPRDVDYDAEEWTTELLRNQVHDPFDVECSEAHIHRLFLI